MGTAILTKKNLLLFKPIWKDASNLRLCHQLLTATKRYYFSIVVEAEGYGVTPFLFKAGEAVGVLRVLPATSLQVTLTTNDGKPAAGVRVFPRLIRTKSFFLLPQSMQNARAQQSDANGVCTFDGLPQGATVQLQIEDERFANLGYEQNNIELQQAVAREKIVLRSGATVRGRVLFPDGKPAAGATVGAQGTGAPDAGGSDVTNDKGEYSIVGLKSGSYNLEVYLDEKIALDWTARAKENLVVSAGEHLTHQNFALIKGALIVGKVVAPDGRTPIANASVAVYGPANPESSAAVQAAQTKADGTYQLRVPGGRQYIYLMGTPSKEWLSPDKPPVIRGASRVEVVMAGNPATAASRFDIADGKTAVVNWTLQRAASTPAIWGRVLDSSGQPVAGASVFKMDFLQYEGQTVVATSDATGRFKIVGERNALQLRSRLGEMATRTSSKNVAGKTAILRLQPRTLATISGRVADAKGEAIARAEVDLTMWQGDMGSTSAVTTTDARGQYAFADLWPDSRYSLRVAAKGFGGMQSNDITLKPNQNTPVKTMTLRTANSYVAGQIVDEKGAPVVGASVSIQDLETPPQLSASDAQGRFRFDGVVTGAISVSVGKNGVYTQRLVATDSQTPIIVLAASNRVVESSTQKPRDEQFALFIGKNAPSLRATAWINSSPQTIASLRGKIVVIDFWSISCGPCVDSMPEVQKLAARFAGKGVVVIGLHDANSSAQELKAFAKAKNLTYALAVDKAAPARSLNWFSQTFADYGVRGIPAVAVIDASGKIAYFDHDLNAATKVVEKLVANKSRNAKL